jgi:F0F1-type ATP synthase membrane subunit b/b'
MTIMNILASIVVIYYYVWLLMGLAYRRKCLKIESRLRNAERRSENLNDLIQDRHNMY